SVTYLVSEKSIMQRSKGFDFVLRLQQQRDVIVAPAIRNHPYGNMFNSIQYTRCVTVRIPTEIAHHTDNRLIAINFHGTEITELLLNFMQVPGVVDGQRNRYFRCCYHVYRRFVAFKHLKNPTQK